MKRIRITAGGIYGANGQLPIGHELTVPDDFKGWNGKWVEVGSDKGKTLEVATPAPAQDDSELAEVRAEYERVTGEKAHGRKKIDTLREEIEAAKQESE